MAYKTSKTPESNYDPKIGKQKGANLSGKCFKCGGAAGPMSMGGVNVCKGCADTIQAAAPQHKSLLSDELPKPKAQVHISETPSLKSPKPPVKELRVRDGIHS